jgi:hypothetical protein
MFTNRSVKLSVMVLLALVWFGTMPSRAVPQVAVPPQGGGANSLLDRVSQLEKELLATQAALLEMQETLAHVSLEEGEINGLAGPHLIVEGCNLHVRNATGFTDEIDGAGNLIVGYNEFSIVANEVRTGSHNLVVGPRHTYSNWGGFVAGTENRLAGAAATVSGGFNNWAIGDSASISGGFANAVYGEFASISGGNSNVASGNSASVSGGTSNRANGGVASISGGGHNQANGGGASVSGGSNNQANGESASVSGGRANRASGIDASVSGGVANDATGELSSVTGGVGNEASGELASVSGGFSNVASHDRSTVSGGFDNATAADYDHVP